MKDLIAKNIEESDLKWSGNLWQRSAVILNSVFVGLGTYQPGWRWSRDARQGGKESEAHTGYILSGKMIVRSASGEESTLGPGDAFEVTANHDAWVVGDEPCVAADFGVKRIVGH